MKSVLSGSLVSREEKDLSRKQLKDLRKTNNNIILNVKNISTGDIPNFVLVLRDACTFGGDGECQNCTKFRGYMRFPTLVENSIVEGFCTKDDIKAENKRTKE